MSGASEASVVAQASLLELNKITSPNGTLRAGSLCYLRHGLEDDAMP